MSQPSSKKLPSAVDGKKHRDLQLDNVQSVRERETLSPTCDVFIKTFLSGLRALYVRWGRKIVRAFMNETHQEKKAI